jgi:dynein heavy chain
MLVFGGHANPTTRLNDTWILNVKDYTWTRCTGDKTVGDNKESPIGAPSPRANAAACFYQGKVYVYGGHGGLNYSRISLDDVYAFDCETQTWEYLEAVIGLQPLPLGRGGHSIFCSEGKLFSYGGWNAEATYNCTICFDLTSHEWTDPDVYSDKPRWNHSAVMVEAIPSWKYFIFGGESMYFSEGAARSFGAC